MSGTKWHRRLSVRLTALAGACGVARIVYDRALEAVAVPVNPLNNDAVPQPEDPWNAEYDVVVVGAGLVGLFAAVDAKLRGLNVALVEAQDAPGFGNTGRHCGAMDPGFVSAQRALKHRDIASATAISDSMREFRAWQRFGLSDDVLKVLPVRLTTSFVGEQVEHCMAGLLMTAVGFGSAFARPVLPSTIRGLFPEQSELSRSLLPFSGGGVSVTMAYLNGAAAARRLFVIAGHLGIPRLMQTEVTGLSVDKNDSERVVLECQPQNEKNSRWTQPKTKTLSSRVVINAAGPWWTRLRPKDAITTAAEGSSQSHSLERAKWAVNSTAVIDRKALGPAVAESVTNNGGLVISSHFKGTASLGVMPCPGKNDKVLVGSVTSLADTGASPSNTTLPDPSADSIFDTLRGLGIPIDTTQVTWLQQLLPLVDGYEYSALRSSALVAKSASGASREAHPEGGSSTAPQTSSSGSQGASSSELVNDPTLVTNPLDTQRLGFQIRRYGCGPSAHTGTAASVAVVGASPLMARLAAEMAVDACGVALDAEKPLPASTTRRLWLGQDTQ